MSLIASKSFSLRITNDITDEVLKDMKTQCEKALIGIGEKAEGYAKDECPVDSGRLRNSITYATSTFHSHGNDRGGESASSKDTGTKATPPEYTVYIGTNVEYAVYVEYGDQNHKVGKKHFLRDAMANHGDHYKEILRAALDT